MVEIGLLHSQPFMKSSFHFLLVVERANLKKMHPNAQAVLLKNSML
jgi:hypothetical protein